jgi:F0F1-type ATP synthase membrane subunit b/b'
MNNEFNQSLAMPLPMIGLAIVMVLLLALTMNAVIKRERAMIGKRRHDSAAQVAYMSRWRNRTAA